MIWWIRTSRLSTKNSLSHLADCILLQPERQDPVALRPRTNLRRPSRLIPDPRGRDPPDGDIPVRRLRARQPADGQEGVLGHGHVRRERHLHQSSESERESEGGSGRLGMGVGVGVGVGLGMSMRVRVRACERENESGHHADL